MNTILYEDFPWNKTNNKYTMLIKFCWLVEKVESVKFGGFKKKQKRKKKGRIAARGELHQVSSIVKMIGD